MRKVRMLKPCGAGFGLAMAAGLLLALQAPAYGQPREDRPGGPGPKPQCPMPGAPGPGGPGLEVPAPGSGPFDFISPEQTEQLMEFLQEHFPRRHRLLCRLRERNPDHFQKRLAEMAPRVLELLLRMKENPELGELLLEQQRLEDELREQVGSYRALDEEDEAERQERRAGIEEIVSRLVEVRLQRREQEIASLERRLQEQKRGLEEDRENRAELVADEMERVLQRRPWHRGPRGERHERRERGKW